MKPAANGQLPTVKRPLHLLTPYRGRRDLSYPTPLYEITVINNGDTSSVHVTEVGKSQRLTEPEKTLYSIPVLHEEQKQEVPKKRYGHYVWSRRDSLISNTSGEAARGMSTMSYERWCRSNANQTEGWSEDKKRQAFRLYLIANIRLTTTKQDESPLIQQNSLLEEHPSLAGAEHPRPEFYVIRARTAEERLRGVSTQECRSKITFADASTQTEFLLPKRRPEGPPGVSKLPSPSTFGGISRFATFHGYGRHGSNGHQNGTMDRQSSLASREETVREELEDEVVNDENDSKVISKVSSYSESLGGNNDVAAGDNEAATTTTTSRTSGSSLCWELKEHDSAVTEC